MFHNQRQIMMLNNKEDKTMTKTENLKPYRTFGLPLLLLMGIFSHVY